MTEPAPAPRKRAGKAPETKAVEDEGSPSAGRDSAQVESLLVEIRDRLDQLLKTQQASHGDPSADSRPAEGKTPEAGGATEAAEADELRQAFPHDEETAPAADPPDAPEAARLAIQIPETDMARLLSTVEDRVTAHALTHHSSVVVLLGWAMALLSAGLGMGYGYIVASGRYPFWEPSSPGHPLSGLAAAYLGAPVGVVLLPLAGAILWASSREAKAEKQRALLRLVAIFTFIVGVALPLVSLL
ncbi:hypothetical protein [Acidithiobacillus sp.]|uniref:hypothetical protein n=1 Tax=Acidithiobacillus sp. TaxID=1872118 RepID=UPI003CFD2541